MEPYPYPNPHQQPHQQPQQHPLPQQPFRCHCGVQFNIFQRAKDAGDHFLQCQQYQAHKGDRMATLSSLIDNLYSEEEHQEFQVLMCALLEKNINLKKRLFLQQSPLKGNGNGIQGAFNKGNSSNSGYNVSNPQAGLQQGNFMKGNFIQQQGMTPSMMDEEEIGMNCQQCLKGFEIQELAFLNCNHVFCKICLKKSVIQAFKDFKDFLCLEKGCLKVISHGNVKELVGAEFYDKLSNMQLEKMKNSQGGQVNCCKCKKAFLLEPGQKIHAPKEDDNGRPLNDEMKEFWAQNRFRCSLCSTEQCRQCSSTPFHLGLTCDEFKNLKPCRFCRAPLDQEVNLQAQPLSEICLLESSCLEKMGHCCKQILACGHRCGGLKGEKTHFCTIADCEDDDNLCAYCAEDLSQGPCLRVRCGHTFHYECLTSCLNKKWPTARMTFNYLNCPECRAVLKPNFTYNLTQQFADRFRERFMVQHMAVEKLEEEGLDQDPVLKNAQSPFFQNKELYAMSKYAIYPCFKCNKPFIGGKVSCEREAQQGEQQQQEMKKEDYICMNCSPLKGCHIHGKEHMIYKCKFCCSLAVWFCFGNTHFCEPCHSKQCKTPSFAKKGPWDQCKGQQLCPLKGNHPSNPSEHVVGCAKCRIAG